MLSTILGTVVGCLLGVLTFKVISLVVPIAQMGDWSTGLLVALCLIWVAVVGALPAVWFRRPAA